MIRCFFILTIVLFSFEVGTLSAQKHRDEKVQIRYVQLPKVKVPNDIQSYRAFISVGANSINYNTIGPSYTDQIFLNGFQKRVENYGLEINLKLGGFQVLETNPRVHKHERKNKDGTVTTTYTYDYFIKYRLPASLTVRGYDGKVYYANTIAKPNSELTAYTKGFNSAYERDDYWKGNKTLFLREKENEAINGFIKQTNSKINTHLAYLTLTYKTKIFYPENSRKTDYDYSSLVEAKDAIKSGFHTRIPNDTSSGNNSIRKAISIWTKEVKTAAFEAKRPRIDEKMARELYINMAIGYMFLYQFDRAEEMLAKAEPLKGRGLWKPTRNKLSDQKYRHNLHPLWNGKRHIEKRKGVNIIAGSKPDQHTQANNQRLSEQSIRNNQPVNNSPRDRARVGIRQNSKLGNLLKTVEVIGGTIKQISGTDTNKKTNTVLPADTKSLKAELAKPSNVASTKAYISYDIIKGIPDEDIKSLTSQARSHRLCHTWRISKVIYYSSDGNPQILDGSMMNGCLAKQSYHFEPSKNCKLTPTCEAPNPNGEKKYGWTLTSDGGMLILIGDKGATNYTIIRLSEKELILETQGHSRENPMTRYFYSKNS